MEEAHGDDPQCIEWIKWARTFAAKLSPLREAPSTPDPPEEMPGALQEFLSGRLERPRSRVRSAAPMGLWSTSVT